tara:strand:- start:1656 stop:1964 length:309 start_codon:yes stop_codon:yes gene_type:complete
MKLILEDYQDLNNNDTFEGTFYYGDDMVKAQISTEWVFDPCLTGFFGNSDFDVHAVVLSAVQVDEEDNEVKLTITNEEIENFVENEMTEFFQDYFEGLAESV